MISEHGGLATARQLLHASTPSDGFTALRQKGRLDLATELQVLQPKFRELFTEGEREIARERLRAYRFDVDEDPQ